MKTAEGLDVCIYTFKGDEATTECGAIISIEEDSITFAMWAYCPLCGRNIGLKSNEIGKINIKLKQEFIG